MHQAVPYLGQTRIDQGHGLDVAGVIFHEASPDRLTALNISIPSAIDPSLAPKGQHVCVLSAFAGAGTRSLSPAGAARLAEALLGRASEILPGLRDHITFVEGEPRAETPFPLHSIGPIYGWATSPGQTGTGRPANRTPISGLFIAGHWAQPSHGILMVVASGLRVARLVLGVDVSRGLIPLAV